MECSVPLLSVRYLTWRATLYTAVCQCYYDCQAGIHGEVGRFSFSGFQFLKYKLFSIFFFRCPATQTQTDKCNLKNCIGTKTQVPGFICRNVLLHSVFSCSTFCSLLSSPFTSVSSAPVLNKISDTFLIGCFYAGHFPSLFSFIFCFPTVHLSCLSLLPAAVCLIYGISCFSSFPLYLLD